VDRMPVGARFSIPVQNGPGPTLPPVQWVPGMGVKRPGRGFYFPPHLAPRLKKYYLCTPLCAFVADNRVNCILCKSYGSV